MTAVLRPVVETDLDALERMAAHASPGLGSLRLDRAGLEARIRASQQAFATPDEEVSGEERYLFALEIEGRVCGCSGIAASAGFGTSFYSYRNEFVVALSPALRLRTRTHTLHLGHDLTGATLLTSFYIEPEAARWQDGAAAQLLSRGRLAFLHRHAQRFAERVAAEFPGWLDAAGGSPFWDAVGRRFFDMDYGQAELLATGRNKTFLADLMPQSPIYVPLLPEDAQRAIGQLHPDAELPFDILQSEGFDTDTHVDIMDGGPIAEARLVSLRSLRTPAPLSCARIAANAQVEGFRAWLAAPGEVLPRGSLALRLELE
ncbi:arginine N-succinyltransferase [Inhella sp.]|uniref:arginine N-succinyltransferase n=1 Tax=Inhella sp. TaxID=1921806 RepID=UPI0035B3DFA2